ncbi:MAG: site-specific integrase, partial [Nitrospinota bacterium]
KSGVIVRIPEFPSIGVIPKPKPKWIDYETQNKVIEEINSKDRPIFYLLTRIGCRPGEARALQRRDFNFTKNEYGTVTIERAFSLDELSTTKTGRSRELVMHPELKEMLEKLAKQKIGPETFVFTNSKGKPYTYNQINKIWARAAKKAKVDINCYAGTRHSVASQMLNNGVPELVVKAILGHQSLTMTGNYAHPSTKMMVEAWTTSAKVVEFKKTK